MYIDQTVPTALESYTHFFLECKHSLQALTPVAEKYNIPIPNLSTKGELVLYFFPGTVTGTKYESMYFMLVINTSY